MTIGDTPLHTARADAFEALFRAEYPRVRAIAGRTGLGAHESEDVAQEVFAQYYRRHPADAPYAAAWLRRAAAHLALNAIRTRRRRDAREAREALASIPTRETSANAWDPDQSLVDDERRREVRRAMARLSDRHAAVLALRYSGMSYAEVASALDVPASHVGTLLRRAESAFKKEYEDAASR
jgi:RNA polymerase sigma-70 factor (ECF subfamily)